jgi:hypothetical protein
MNTFNPSTKQGKNEIEIHTISTYKKYLKQGVSKKKGYNGHTILFIRRTNILLL